MPSNREISQQNSYSILVGWLIDGTGSPCRRDMVVEISEGIITSIKRVGQYETDLKEILNYSHYTIIPGFVDSHVHLAMSGDVNPEIRKKQQNAKYDAIKDKIRTRLSEHLTYGIVAVRDGGDCKGHAYCFMKEHKDSMPIIVRSPGWAWHAQGRYGRLLGRPPYDNITLAESVLRDSNLQHHIKIINSGLNNLSSFKKETYPQFNNKDLKEVVSLGKKLGKKVMVHANGEEAVGSAIDAGCDSIEHGFFMGKDNIRIMSEKEITWVPTVFTMNAYSKILPKGSVESDNAKRYLDHQMEQIFLADQYGVKMAAGTDAGSVGVHHGKTLGEEIKLLIAAGLSIESSIQCATANGSGLIDHLDLTGKLETGLPATFILMNGDPKEILKRSFRPESVFIKGKMVISD